MAQCRVCDPAGAETDADGEPDPDGEPLVCPTCGREMGPPVKAPWHFKLLVVSVVIYLGWRAWQGLEWVLGKL